MRLETQRGMTLIELLIATVLTGFLMVYATRLADAIGDAAQRARLDGNKSTNTALDKRFFTLVMMNAQTAHDSTIDFVGDDRTIQFLSLCVVTRGWIHPCRVRMTIEVRGDAAVVLAAVDDRVIVVDRGDGSLRFQYLEEPGAQWQFDWHRPKLPAALAVTDRRHTLVVPIGPGL